MMIMMMVVMMMMIIIIIIIIIDLMNVTSLLSREEWKRFYKCAAVVFHLRCTALSDGFYPNGS